MEFSEKTKIHVYGIFMILMSVSFLFIDNYSDKTLQIICVAFFTLLYIMNSFNSIKVLLYEEEDAVLKNIPRFLCVRRKRLPLW